MLLGAHWPYMGVPPSQLGYLAATASWMALMEPGPVGVRGSFQSLADALAGAIEQNGGECLYGSGVTEILLDGERVAGAQLENGRELRAPIVISNADARLTFEDLLDADHVPERFLRRMRRMKPSISAFLLFSACTLPVHEQDLAAETFVYDHWDHDATWADLEGGGLGGMWISVPTLHDDSIAPAGEHIVSFTSLVPYDVGRPWPELKEQMTEAMLARLERVLPGYRDSITFLDSATPETFREYTLAQDGAVYGWENTPGQTLPKRLPQQTPIEGLYLAGHWTNPGTGSVRCLLSGLGAAATVQGHHDPIEFLQALA